MKPSFWLILFMVDVAVELLAISFQLERVRFISKPLLILFLIGYAVVATKQRNNLFTLLIAALCFSVLGDIFLLFEQSHPIYFMMGLVSFMLAHIFYILLFNQIRVKNQPEKKWALLSIILLGVYVVFLFLLLEPSLGSLKIPVLVYALVLSAMFLSAIQAFDISKQSFGKICVLGSLFFVISDSLLAIDKFRAHFPMASFTVMATYITAQFLLVLGISKYLNLKSG
ncbi:MAG: lysoplasmalogenase [Bacteroidetes bacterium]|nr:lysoplasmalogenase [Bacteroidota bacterium]